MKLTNEESKQREKECLSIGFVAGLAFGSVLGLIVGLIIAWL